GFFLTGTKPLVRIRTREGYSLRLTANHRVRRVSHFTRYSTSPEWCEAGELKPGDLVALQDHRSGASWSGAYTYENGYLAGLLIGDGTMTRDGAVLSVWQRPVAASAEVASISGGVEGVMTQAEAAIRMLPYRADVGGWCAVRGRNEFRMKSAALSAM